MSVDVVDVVGVWWIRAVRWIRAVWPERTVVLLAAVAVGFFLLQLGFMGLRYGYGWDEAVYLSMANPAVPDAAWSPWRAWGTPLLAAPVALVNAPLAAVRLYLMLLSSAGLFLAFRVWLGVRRTVSVPVAAFLFATVFVTVYYGLYAMPNYYVAVGSVASVGWFLRSGEPGRTAWIALAGWVGMVALVRPSDSLWLVGVLGIACLVTRPRQPRTALALLAGEIVGWLPWVVEAYARFGGVAHRWALSRAGVGGRLHLDLTTIELYVRMSGGARLMCYCADRPRLAGHVNVAVLAWWGVAGLAVLAAVPLARWHSYRIAPAVLSIVAGVSLAVPYLWVLEYAASRFVLPSLALLSLPVAQTLVYLGQAARPSLRPLVVAAVVATLAAHAGLQFNVLRLRMPGDYAVHEAPILLGERIRQLGVHPSCVVVGEPTPMLLNYLPCQWEVAGRSAYLTVEPPAVREARLSDAPVAVLTRHTPPAGSYLCGWRLVSLDIPTQPGWHLYLPPAHPAPHTTHRLIMNLGS
jgi:hypothetical protein